MCLSAEKATSRCLTARVGRHPRVKMCRSRSNRRDSCDEDHIRFRCELQRLGSSRVKLPTSLEVFAQIASIFCTSARKSCVFLVFLLHSPSKRVAWLIALSNIHLSNSPDLFCLGPRTKGQSREDGQSRNEAIRLEKAFPLFRLERGPARVVTRIARHRRSTQTRLSSST